MSNVIKATRSASSYNPKTTLSFFAIVLGIMAGVTTAVAVPLAFSPLVWVVPWVLILFLVFALVLVGAVYRVMVRDPSKLMLQGVSGTEYVEIQSLLGDSVSGERVVIERLAIEEETVATITVLADESDADNREATAENGGESVV